jgi:dihydroorotate dehydrogenase (fumarate)
MTALETSYLGLRLRNPLVASASPLSNTVDGVRRLADAGVGAVVLYSLFEEQLRQEAAANAALADAGTESFAESLSYFSAAAGAHPGPGRYLSLLERAAAAVDIPVIASLNGATTGGWTGYASALEQAGAAAIELNIYYLPGDPPPTSPAGFVPARDVEQRHVEILTAVKAVTSVPVAVKLSPYFSSPGEMALRLEAAGADGLVLFNRFLQPDIDPETLAVTAGFGLSSPAEARLPRTWIALLARRLRASLGATTGVADPADVARYLLAGADVVMTASALLRHGPGYAGVLLDGLTEWMERKGFASVADLRGLLSVPAGPDGAGFERAGYVAALEAANAHYGTWQQRQPHIRLPPLVIERTE